MSAENKPNIYHRLQIAIDKSGAAGKTGQAAREMGGFAYHKIDDVVDHLRAILIDAGIALVPSVESCDIAAMPAGNKTCFHAKTFINVKLVNVDKPDEFIEMRTVGDGIDYGDKSTGKAFSYAMKNILLSVFQLRGQPDNEDDNAEAPAQQGKVTQPPASQPAPPASQPPKQNGHKPSMEERKAAPWAVPDLSSKEQKVPDWKKIVCFPRGQKHGGPAPLGQLKKQELKWYCDNWTWGDQCEAKHVELRVALNIARKELAVEEASGPEPTKEWPAPGDDPFV